MTICFGMLLAWAAWQALSVTSQAIDRIAYRRHAKDCVFCRGQTYDERQRIHREYRARDRFFAKRRLWRLA